MYVISLKWREMPGQPVASCAFCDVVCECGETQGLERTATYFRFVWSISDSCSQTVSSPPPVPRITHRYAGIYRPP